MTEHACSKSGEISSLMTATLNGDVGRANSGFAAQAAAAIPDPARKMRREKPFIFKLLVLRLLNPIHRLVGFGLPSVRIAEPTQ
jgi:hypothetical protein